MVEHSPEFNAALCRLWNLPNFFFWEGGEEGSAYYSRNMAAHIWPLLDAPKYQLGSAIGMTDLALYQISQWQFCFSVLPFYRFA